MSAPFGSAQAASPKLHACAHAPFEQISLTAQVTPQAPQLVGSFTTSVQTSPSGTTQTFGALLGQPLVQPPFTHTAPLPHEMPHPPQSFGSFAKSVHTLPQRFGELGGQPCCGDAQPPPAATAPLEHAFPVGGGAPGQMHAPCTQFAPVPHT